MVALLLISYPCKNIGDNHKTCLFLICLSERVNLCLDHKLPIYSSLLFLKGFCYITKALHLPIFFILFFTDINPAEFNVFLYPVYIITPLFQSFYFQWIIKILTTFSFYNIDSSCIKFHNKIGVEV